MHHHLFDRVNIRPENTHFPDGKQADAQKACAEYDAVMEKTGRTDLQLLGLGPDGHIGFNEPEDFFPAGTHKVALTEEVPRFAYTMGVAGIMKARRVLMVVSGKSKAGILKEALCGPVVPQVPASVLQLHPDFVLVADEEALSEMEGAQ